MILRYLIVKIGIKLQSSELENVTELLISVLPGDNSVSVIFKDIAMFEKGKLLSLPLIKILNNYIKSHITSEKSRISLI